MDELEFYWQDIIVSAMDDLKTAKMLDANDEDNFSYNEDDQIVGYLPTLLKKAIGKVTFAIFMMDKQASAKLIINDSGAEPEQEEELLEGEQSGAE